LHGTPDRLIGDAIDFGDLAQRFALLYAVEDIRPVFRGNTTARFIRPRTVLFLWREDGGLLHTGFGSDRML
jgi:hypothetical protein